MVVNKLSFTNRLALSFGFSEVSSNVNTNTIWTDTYFFKQKSKLDHVFSTQSSLPTLTGTRQWDVDW